MTTGSQLLSITRAALRFVQADQQRQAARRAWQHVAGMDIAKASELRAAYRSCAAQVAGYRRGLARACADAIVTGVDVPDIRKFIDA